MAKRRTKNRKLDDRGGGCSLSAPALALLASAALSACSGNPLQLPTVSTDDEDQEQVSADAAPGVRIHFRSDAFYGIVDSNPRTSCAGDARTFYDPFAYNDPELATLADLDETSAAEFDGDDAFVASNSTSLAGPVPFDEDSSLPGETTRPSFVKNVSVDLTNSNAPVRANNASSCALDASLIASSSCASFDFGSIGGVPTSLGGTVLMVGGIQGYSWSGLYPTDSDTWSGVSAPSAYQGITAACGPVAPDSALPGAVGGDATVGRSGCSQSIFALAVDALPASTIPREGAGSPLAPGLDDPPSNGESISSWANLVDTDADVIQPGGRSGASIAYNSGASKALLFGGSVVLEDYESEGLAADSLETWVYDLKEQSWERIDAQVTAAYDVLYQKDYGITEESPESSMTSYRARASGGRAYFGYAAVPRIALQGFSPYVGDTLDADRTDRLVILGGQSNGDEPHLVRKFNPTFGPEWADTRASHEDQQDDDGTTLNSTYSQWMEPYPSGLLVTAMQYYHPDTNDDGDGDDDLISIPRWMGMAPLIDANGGAGYFLSAGGFDSQISNFSEDGDSDMSDDSENGSGSYDHRTTDGRLMISRRYDDGGTASVITPSTLGFTPNNAQGERASPLEWEELGSADGPIGRYGGGLLLPGLSMADRELVFVGGSSCLNFMTDSTLQSSDCDHSNPGVYLSLDDADFSDGIDAPTTSVPSSPPTAAGMAGARGFDDSSSGNPIIVAWGGMVAPRTVADTPSGHDGNEVFILYDDGGTPTWTTIEAPTGDVPSVLTAASMVYSHVTRKFYVYGGYQVSGLTGTNGDLYELTISGSAGTFSAAWRLLDEDNGLTCSPECPTARRGHGMVEVNYQSPETITDLDDGTADSQACDDSGAPCSHAIFMEGGTPDGSTLLSDRWMFDPTANGGRGHWQQVNDFPPRRLAASASVSVTPLSTSGKDWVVLYGGETGMQSPNQSYAGSYFVAPTLADTMLYDFGSKTWQRMRLLGKGFSSATAASSELDRRQSYEINDTGDASTATFKRPQSRSGDTITYTDDDTIAELAPPPLSGAAMVVRTLPEPLRTASSAVTPLAIPEVFLVGGRLKDGKPMPLSQMYKLCIGSPGERIPEDADTDDAACDAYDSSTNTDSPAPLGEAAGRWIRKQPDSTATGEYELDPSTTGAVMAAAAYDSQEDRILVYGGINTHDGSDFQGITTTSSADLDGDGDTESVRRLNERIYEYEPPTKLNGTTAEYHGSWRQIPNCVMADGSSMDTPTARYGHAMHYDPVKKHLLVIGGFDIEGTPLTQSVSIANPETEYTAPEVWTATRITRTGKVNDPVDVNEVAYVDEAETTEPSESTPCYYWRKKTVFGNSTEITTNLPPQTAIGHAASVFIPPTGYNTGYYSMFDDQCTGMGPFNPGDHLESRKYAGGVNIDIDRSALGSNENLLMNLTTFPLGSKNQKPDGSRFAATEEAVFRVHLMKVGDSQAELQAAIQPRYLWYSNVDSYPTVVKTIEVLAPSSGEPRQDQLLLPIAIDPEIDRIRIERVSGSAIFIDATLFRLGNRD